MTHATTNEPCVVCARALEHRCEKNQTSGSAAAFEYCCTAVCCGPRVAGGHAACTSRVSPAWVRDESSYHIREIRPGSAEDTPHKSRILLFAFWAWGGKREGYQVVRLRVYNCYARTELCKVLLLGGRDEGRRTMDHYTLDITIYIASSVSKWPASHTSGRRTPRDRTARGDRDTVQGHIHAYAPTSRTCDRCVRA